MRVVPRTTVYSAENLERALLGFVWIFVAVGLFGYSFFTLNPENLARFPMVAGLHTPAMIWLAQFQSALLVLIVFLRTQRLTDSLQAWTALGVLSFIGFLSELLGTTTGLPFGSYSYTDLLGYKILGHVPWVIPPSWFTMGVPCFVLAVAAAQVLARHFSMLSGRTTGVVLRAAIGAWLLTSWDFLLDPAMSALLPYWEWHEPGFYYASPFMNFVGWFLTGLVIMLALEGLLGAAKAARIGVRWSGSFYALNCAMSAGMCALSGEWLPWIVTAVALSPALWLAKLNMGYEAERHSFMSLNKDVKSSPLGSSLFEKEGG